LCGSSFINEKYEDLLIRKLRNETYLERDDKTIAKIIDGLVVGFETQDKRNMDQILSSGIPNFTVYIPGLKENKKKNFQPGRMILTRYALGLT
jgi:hypothetical protein